MQDATTRELGTFKTKIMNALARSEKINALLNDSNHGQFKDHVKGHLFVDDTVKDTSSYIFFDVYMSEIQPHIKNISVVIYAIAHRDILDNYSEQGYFGNRTDILSQMIEEALIDEKVRKDFGIGDLNLNAVNIYNANNYYGRILYFNVPNFR